MIPGFTLALALGVTAAAEGTVSSTVAAPTGSAATSTVALIGDAAPSTVETSIANPAATSTIASPPALASRTVARRVPDGAITVDGHGDDAIWASIPFADGFIQQNPDEGRPPTERTRLKVAYDSGAIYFLVEALDSRPQEILGQLTRRDGDSSSDWIHLWLDTNDDHRTAYRFSVNAVGVRQDARVYDDNVEDINWDAVWEAVAATSTSGWTAELRVPFSQLRYDETHPRWGFEARRDLRRRNEQSYLTAIPRGSGRMVSQFGTLEGLEQLPAPADITAVPYVRGAYVNDDGKHSANGTVGAEARASIGSSIILDLTANPDFGQVEADPSVLNLTATETYFEEKRPFFLEGKEIFNYKLNFGDGNAAWDTLFYSRRVGKEAILGAAKLTGKTTDGWSFGVLDSVSAHGDEEPLANAAVARVSKDLREGQTTIGLLGTDLIHRLDPSTRPDYLRHAVSGGLDFHHRIDDYHLIAKFFATDVEGSKDAIDGIQRDSVHYFQRPDATHFHYDPDRTELFGWGTLLVAGNLDGTRWRGIVGVQLESPGFEPNPLGYLPLTDRQVAFSWMQLRDDTPGDLLRLYRLNFNTFVQRTFGEELEGYGGNINFNGRLINYIDFWMGIGPSGTGLDPTALRGGPGLLTPGRWDFWFGGKTDDRDRVAFQLDTWGYFKNDDAGSDGGIQVTAKIRPASSLEISLSPLFEHQVDDLQFVACVRGTEDCEEAAPKAGDEYVLGHLTRNTASLAARVDWTLEPKLSVQLYIAPYLTAGTYRNFKSVVAPRADAYQDRFGTTNYDGSNVFFFSELRSNFVVRWEYALGSTLFFVWQHGQTVDVEKQGVLKLGHDLPELVSSPASDTLMVKMAYWFAP